MTLVRNGNRITVSARDFPTNKGGLCRKGWTAAELLEAPDRLTTPLMRDHKGDQLRKVSWDEALERIASEMQSISEIYGRDAVAVFGGGGLTNEKAYLLGKFARVALRTANIDYNGRFCMASAAAAGLRAFGIDRGLPFPIEDIPGAEAILLVGSNPAETMPPIMQYFDEQQRRGGQLIVADPRRTATAAVAALHLELSPGSDAALANGLLHVAIQDGLIDRDSIATRTAGFETVRRVVASSWPDRVERITGVPERQLRLAAHMLGEARTAMLLTARGAEQQSHGVDNVLSFINLMLALGHAGKAFSGSSRHRRVCEPTPRSSSRSRIVLAAANSSLMSRKQSSKNYAAPVLEGRQTTAASLTTASLPPTGCSGRARRWIIRALLVCFSIISEHPMGAQYFIRSNTAHRLKRPTATTLSTSRPAASRRIISPVRRRAEFPL